MCTLIVASFNDTGHEMFCAMRIHPFRFAVENTRRPLSMPRQMNPNTVVDFFPVLEPLSSSDAIILMTMLLYSSKSFSSKG